MNAPDINAYWMPFTANRDGLWTSGAGHCHPKIVEAVQKQVAELDFAMTFQIGNDKAFALAERVINMAPEGFTQCFFTNSGSESVDTALKIALGYHRARSEGNRTRLIGRERAYHGVNFGGMSVGGSLQRKPHSGCRSHAPHREPRALGVLARTTGMGRTPCR